MKGINVSLTPGLFAFASRFLARLIKTIAPGRVYAPDTHPRLIVGSKILEYFKYQYHCCGFGRDFYDYALEELK